MKNYKEITVKTKRLIKTTCDMCGDEITTKGSDVNETKIYHKTGEQFAEGGNGEIIDIDLCSNCFDKKLIPFLRKQGCDIRIEQWEWC